MIPFYYTLNNNRNSHTRRLPLTKAQELYYEICESPQATMEVLKTGNLRKTRERWYRALNRHSEVICPQWGSPVTHVYDFSNNTDFHLWTEYLQTALLPNYDTQEYTQLSNLQHTQYRYPRVETQYDRLSEEIITVDGRVLEFYRDEDELPRTQRLEEARRQLITIILDSYPTPHVKRLLDLKSQVWRHILYRTYSYRIRLNGLHPEHPLNGIVAQLLDGSPCISGEMFQQIDHIDHTIIDRYAQLRGIEITPYVDTHRDIYWRTL